MAIPLPAISRTVALSIAMAACDHGVAQTLDIETILAPVIAFEAHVPESARTARTLGTVRGGTAVVIDGDGLVLTIGYLILEAESVELLLDGPGGERVPAEVVAWDEVTGLGLLRSSAPLDITPMPLGESAALRVDDPAVVVSWEREAGLLPAVITNRGPYPGYWEYLLEDALYVAPIHPAFPGAALVGLDGTLVGIGGFAHFDTSEEAEMADTVFVPIDALKTVLADLLLNGRSAERRPWLGLYCEEDDAGLRVFRVPPDSPASKAGIMPGDRLMTVAGTPVDSLEAFYRDLWSTARPADHIALGLRRDGVDITVEVVAMDRYEP